MIKCIKRFFDSSKGIVFSTSWESMDLDEKLSLFAALVSDSELTRVLSVIEKDETLSLEQIDKIQVFEAQDGLITFKNSGYQMLFFRQIDNDL